MDAETADPYDLFVSYAEADRAWVEGYLLDALRQAGVRCLSEAAFALGAPRLLEFERAVRQCRRTLLVLSPAYLADDLSLFINLLAQTYGLETATWRVIPVLLAPAALPARLAMLTALDATDPGQWAAVVGRLCAELRRPAPGPAPIPACPYPGMVPFTEADAHAFFGREQHIDDLWQRLRQQNYLFVIGPSGSGKSSLVFAGLVPLLGRVQPGEWAVRSIHPGETPLAHLERALGGAVEPGGSYEPLIAALLAQEPPARRLLLVIDQFEELFTQTSEPEQALFIAALQALREVPQCALVMTMRADFYPNLMSSVLWPEHSEQSAAQRIEIVPLRGQGLRDAIAKPAAGCGVYLEAVLLERLLADAAGAPGVLPLLQETMVLLWAKMERRMLTLRAYEQLGRDGRSGFAVAIATKAEAALATLPQPAQIDIARRILLRLIFFGEGLGEGRLAIRREQPVSALLTANDKDDQTPFNITLDHLVKHRLLTLSGEEKVPDRKVNIAHEALIDGWPALKDWIKNYGTSENDRRELEAKASEWSERARDGRGGGLLDEVELREAQQWLDGPAAADLGYSTELLGLVTASERAIRPPWDRRGALALGAGASGVIAVVAWLVFFLQTTPVPDTVRSAAFWGAVLLAGVVSLVVVLLLRADRYFLPRLSLTIARRSVVQLGAVICLVAATALWTWDGTQRFQTEQFCINLGFNHNSSVPMVAVVDMTGNSDDVPVNFFVSALMRATKQGVMVRVVDSEQVRRCRGFIDKEIVIKRSDSFRRGEISLNLSLVDIYSGNVNETDPIFGPDVCGLFGMLSVQAASNLGFDGIHLDGSLDALGPSNCAAVDANDRGYRYLEEHQYTEAEREFLLAIKLFSDYPMAYNNLGRVYYETGRYKEGIISIRKAIELSHQPFTPFLINLGVACYQAKDYQCAEQANMQVLEIEPDNTDALNNMAVSYREWGKYEQSQVLLERFEAILMKQPQDKYQDDWHTLFKNRGVLLFKMGKLHDADEILNKALLKGNRFEEEIIYYQAMIAFKQGELEESCKYIRIYAEINQNSFLEANIRRIDLDNLGKMLKCY